MTWLRTLPLGATIAIADFAVYWFPAAEFEPMRRLMISASSRLFEYSNSVEIWLRRITVWALISSVTSAIASGSAQAQPTPSKCLAPTDALRAPCFAWTFIEALDRIAVASSELKIREPRTESEALNQLTEIAFQLREKIRLYGESCVSLQTAATGGDSTLTESADELCNALAGFSSIDSLTLARLVSSTSGKPDTRAIGERADDAARLRQRSNATTSLFLLASVTVTYALLEPTPDRKRMRLRMTNGDRLALIDQTSVDTSNPATDRHFKTGHHDDGLRLVIGSA